MSQLAFVLLRYFPHGGQQRDFLRIALALQRRGHKIRVYTTEWQGDLPPGFDLQLLPVRTWLQHRRYPLFSAQLQEALATAPADCVIGFNRLPGLDVYFAADGCFEEKAQNERAAAYRWTPRYRQLRDCEAAVFGVDAHTRVLLLTELQREQYLRHYPESAERLHLLPPGLSRRHACPPDAERRRNALRSSLDLQAGHLLLLQVGSGFAVKGVERSIRAIASLPRPLRQRCRLVIIGDDKPGYYRRLAQSLHIADQIEFLGGRDDVPDWMLAADLLLHPAFSESAGHVLLESLVYGLPVLTTDRCGYASHIRAAEAGWVCPSPYRQSAFNVSLQEILGAEEARERWRANARTYCLENDLCGLEDAAADHIEQLASEARANGVPQ